MAASYLARQYNQPFDDLARKYCLLGPPAACVDRLAEFVAAGVGTFVIYFTVPPDRDAGAARSLRGRRPAPRVELDRTERRVDHRMADLTGGELVARVLAREGVGAIFTLCGGHVLPIYDACLRHGIRVIDVRHEQAAAHAADAWARLTRGLGVAVVVPGPGVTDAVTGVANAHAARSPLLLIGGGSPLGLKGRGALQEMDQVSLLRPITKGAWAVPEPRLIPEYLARAVDVALSGQPGPVFVEIAVDLLMSTVDERGCPPAGARAAWQAGARRRRDRPGGGAAGLGRAPRHRGGERRLLGRSVERAGRPRRARRDPRLHERHGTGMSPARPPDGVPAGARARPPRGGRRGRPGHAARLPARLRPGARVRRRRRRS